MAGQARVMRGGPGVAGGPFGKNGAPNPTKTLKRTHVSTARRRN